MNDTHAPILGVNEEDWFSPQDARPPVINTGWGEG